VVDVEFLDLRVVGIAVGLGDIVKSGLVLKIKSFKLVEIGGVTVDVVELEGLNVVNGIFVIDFESVVVVEGLIVVKGFGLVVGNVLVIKRD
jgi:hypothetical protein